MARKRERSQLMYTLVRSILWCIAQLFFRIRVKGKENIPRTGGALLVSNHISYADSVFAGITTPRPARYLMWKPIYDVPVGNYFFRLLHAIPIDERSPKSTIRALHAAREELLAGNLVVIFAEGAISRDGNLGPFERGFQKILKGTRVPVIPIFIDGLWGHPLSCKGGGVLKSWELLRPKVTITVGTPISDPISPEELHNRVASLASEQETLMVG
jgi:acyl-[acyl-carrier-protein]-phospholipid O-acyltransferase/long-chain-fatty-acid--[acyl-carrier-protein] ligase